VTAGGVLGYLGHLLYLVIHGKLTFANDYIAHNLGSGVSIDFIFYPIFCFTIAGIALVVFSNKMRRTIHSAVRNETISSQLGRFFSPKVRDEIISMNEQVELQGGKLQNVAVLFSDIRNFTRYCENKTPGEIVNFLKEYQTLMVDIIFRHNGTLDKFIGDGIMATFGTPSVSAEDADNAIKAAMEMSSALQAFNKRRIAQGLEEMNIGIGIHYGPVIVGSIGSENRLEYTVIGDTVNTASRLETATKELKREIIFSEELKNNFISTKNSIPIGSIEIRGRQTQMQVYSV
jgi:adenylate cyclase